MLMNKTISLLIAMDRMFSLIVSFSRHLIIIQIIEYSHTKQNKNGSSKNKRKAHTTIKTISKMIRTLGFTEIVRHEHI